jgi:glycosyltransferase involved in cell wall biosynthesis
MSAGCPVICSDKSSIPEIVGNAGAYFDPQSEENMAVVIESVVTDTARSEELRRAGLNHLQNYSWEKCAANTLGVYESLLSDA